ncbi:unnamed protein product, partial [marine sediment metagenome]
QVLCLRVNNRANSPLTLNTVVYGSGVGVFDLSTLPQNESIPVSNGYDFDSASVNDTEAAEWSGTFPISISGDAKPGTYSLTFTFTRE